MKMRQVASQYDNPFDKFANSKKKHDVLNRKVKGEDRNVGRARAKAVDERKKKLLGDYNRSKKSSIIVDRRFGENDPEMSVEEKMFLRFQKERMKKSRNSSVFNLDHSDNNILTHKGQSIDDQNILDDEWGSSDDDNGNLDKEVVNTLHFGGGLVHKPPPINENTDGNKWLAPGKTRLDALQEIVMKSKLYKIQKKEAKEDQENQRLQLDEEFSRLFDSSLISYNGDYGKKFSSKDDTNILDGYDKSMKEMLFESKVQPSNRTKSLEEIAVENISKLEGLEKARLKRMREIVEECPRESKRQKSSAKMRIRNDDELDDFEREDLQENGHDIEENCLYEADEKCISDTESIYDNSSEEEGSQMQSSDHELYESKASNEVPTMSNQMLMPHQIPCPRDYSAFKLIVRRYAGANSEDFGELLNRIFLWNNIHLPGTQGIENRKLMHNFLDILLRFFVEVGDNLCETTSPQIILQQLDHLSVTIFSICNDLEQASVSLWCRTLKLFHQQSLKQQRDYSLKLKTSSWPSLGKLLFLQLVGNIFSSSDLKNNMICASSLILSECLTKCTVASYADLASGLLCCGILLEYSRETSKILPEVVAFLNSVLSLYLPKKCLNKNVLGTFKVGVFQGLRESLASNKIDAVYDFVKWNTFSNNFMKEEMEFFSGQCLFSVYRMIGCDFLFRNSLNSFPEQIATTFNLLKQLKPHVQPQLPKSLQMHHLCLLENIQQCMIAKMSRAPLRWRTVRKDLVESKAPSYSVSYVMKKDQDGDKDQAKLKQLTRHLKREKKAAMRELRRDANFIDQERYKEKTALQETKRAERLKNYAWMETQQATVNQQVKKGKSLLKGGGSAIGKKAMVGKR